jgi:hypothetical protein
MKFLLNISFILLISNTLLAQLPGSGISLESNVLDGVYIQEHIPRIYTPSKTFDSKLIPEPGN